MLTAAASAGGSRAGGHKEREVPPLPEVGRPERGGPLKGYLGTFYEVPGSQVPRSSGEHPHLFPPPKGDGNRCCNKNSVSCGQRMAWCEFARLDFHQTMETTGDFGRVKVNATASGKGGKVPALTLVSRPYLVQVRETQAAGAQISLELGFGGMDYGMRGYRLLPHRRSGA